MAVGLSGASAPDIHSFTLFLFTLLFFSLLCGLSVVSSTLSVILSGFSALEILIKVSLLRILAGTSFLLLPFKSQYSRTISISSRLFPTIRIYRRWIPADVSTPNASKTLLSKRERLTHPCTTSLMSCGLQSPPTPSDIRKQSSSSHFLKYPFAS